VVSVPGYRTEIELQATERRCIVFPERYELNLYMLCRRKYIACGLVVRVPGYRSRGPGLIHGAALPDFLRSSGFGTEYTPPPEYNSGTT
jgi:hypothetical protein